MIDRLTVWIINNRRCRGKKRSITARAVRTEEEEQHKKRKMQKLHQPQALES